MKKKSDRLMDARRLALTDADIAHLKVVIESSLREPNRALPVSYWRGRLQQLRADVRLLPAQAQQIQELVDRLQQGTPDDGANP
ncbi:hypothetical protein P9281_01355 [Caballeronia sp. LP003]|uniref:hypothetical protein n=1 Tax=Caballeronia sp. LP003 TaxID=3038551 RepID=UPI002859A257|nr:hypothetical protein [Caballeronia sp. LP003]MDR5785211.1 hypothetical protein [Caballeronia sp. LP003]